MTFTHADDCPTPNAQLDQASEGRLKCAACKYVSTAPTQTEHPAVIVSRYVCRAHPHLPVNANGKGCPACDRDRQAAQRTKRAKRAKATEART